MMVATEFTPVSALLGGAMIGLSALLLLAGSGRIAGISGIVGNMLTARGADLSWRMAFTIGLLGGAAAWLYLTPPGTLELNLQAGLPLMLLAGFVVGVGTSLGRGCTSGHGVCGIGRVSPRSLTATMVFMLTAGITVYVTRHLIGGGA